VTVLGHGAGAVLVATVGHYGHRRPTPTGAARRTGPARLAGRQCCPNRYVIRSTRPAADPRTAKAGPAPGSLRNAGDVSVGDLGISCTDAPAALDARAVPAGTYAGRGAMVDPLEPQRSGAVIPGPETTGGRATRPAVVGRTGSRPGFQARRPEGRASKLPGPARSRRRAWALRIVVRDLHVVRIDGSR